MNTLIIGVDLAVTAAHKAIVLDQASNTYVSPVLTFHTDPADLDYVLTVPVCALRGKLQVTTRLHSPG